MLIQVRRTTRDDDEIEGRKQLSRSHHTLALTALLYSRTPPSLSLVCILSSLVLSTCLLLMKMRTNVRKKADYDCFRLARYNYLSSGDWVPKIRVPKGNTRTRTKIWVWVGLGLCLNTMGIFGLGTHKILNFGFFWVLPLGTREYWVPEM